MSAKYLLTTWWHRRRQNHHHHLHRRLLAVFGLHQLLNSPRCPSLCQLPLSVMFVFIFFVVLKIRFRTACEISIVIIYLILSLLSFLFFFFWVGINSISPLWLLPAKEKTSKRGANWLVVQRRIRLQFVFGLLEWFWKTLEVKKTDKRKGNLQFAPSLQRQS